MGLKASVSDGHAVAYFMLFSSPPEEDTLQRSVSQMRQQIAQCSDPSGP